MIHHRMSQKIYYIFKNQSKAIFLIESIERTSLSSVKIKISWLENRVIDVEWVALSIAILNLIQIQCFYLWAHEGRWLRGRGWAESRRKFKNIPFISSQQKRAFVKTEQMLVCRALPYMCLERNGIFLVTNSVFYTNAKALSARFFPQK